MAQASKRAGQETTEGIVADAHRRRDGHDRRGRLRDRARLEERGVPRVRRAGARRGRRGRPGSGYALEDERASSSARSARTSPSAARRASSRRTASRSRRTCIRRRTRSACSCSVRGGSPEASRAARDAHRRSRPALRDARRGPGRGDRERARRSTRTPEVQSKPEQAREKIVEGMLGKRFFARRCSPSSRGSTSRRRPSGRRSRRKG